MQSRHHSIQRIRRNYTACEPQTAQVVGCWSEQFDQGETSCRGLAVDNMGECDFKEGHQTRSSNLCEDGKIGRRIIRVANSPDWASRQDTD